MKPLAYMSVKELRQVARDEGYSSITRLTRKRELIAAIMKMRNR